jgi:tRNA (guanine26-N2/guanine27-N2)-dimethyltransferase
MIGEYTEGLAQFQVEAAFYRAESRVARDLGVLAAIAHCQQIGHLRVLDAMSGCGVRTLRYWLEAGASDIWANDANSDLADLMQTNLKDAVRAGVCRISQQDAMQVFQACQRQQEKYGKYDLVDVDGFGSPGPWLAASLSAVAPGGLLYLTITDGSTFAGRYPQNCLITYGAYAHWHPASQEQGLRLILGKLQQESVSQSRGIQPIFSLCAGNRFRVMVKLLDAPVLNLENYGFLGYCPHCGDYRVVPWSHLSKSHCQRDQKPLKLSGPLWLGELHHKNWLLEMRSLSSQRSWSECTELLDCMMSEIGLPPYFYLLGEIGRRGKLDIPPRSRLINTLHTSGFLASATHIEPQAIKTNADLQTCVAIARNL